MRTAILGLALLSSPALAAPGFVPVQGVLTDSNGVAVDGAVDVTFSLFSDSTGTTSLWTDTITVDVVNGKFATELGSSLALDLDTFSNFAGVHLQITVAGDSPMPMVPLDHVPYAAHALNTDKLGGASLDDIRAEIPLTSDIQGAARDAAYDTEQELTDVLDDNYVVTAGTGISITNNAISADQTTIEGWARGVAYDTEQELTDLLDDNYVVTAGAGISISNNQISVDQATVQGWANAVDDDTTYLAGTGLDLSNTTFSVNKATVQGWANEVDDNTTYLAGTGLSLSNTTFNVDQSTIEGWAQGVAYNSPAEVVGALSGQSIDVDLNCPANYTAVAGGRLCVSAQRSPANAHAAIADCSDEEARVCTHTDLQQACGAGLNPYSGATNGWYGDHGLAPGGNTDDEYLTWNVANCASNNDGPPANYDAVYAYVCCQ